MKRLCTICARGGSKGVKGKNVRLLQGKPLLVYSIEQARASGLFDVIAVSSDSQQILGIAQQAGVEFLVRRPDILATDQAAKLPVIRHCVAEVEQRSGIRFDTLVDLDATSPLRLAEDITGAVVLLEQSGAGNVITAMPSRRSPYFNLVEINKAGAVTLCKPPSGAIVRRQDAPPCFDMNASVYVWKHDVLFSSETVFNADTKLFVMPEERSIDIDSEVDFKLVDLLLQERLAGRAAAIE